MCFDVHPDHREPKTATNDIRCYKVLAIRTHLETKESALHAPYRMKAMYELGKTQSILKLRPKDGAIQRGLHSFSTRDEARAELLSWDPQDDYKYKRRYRVFEATIPKGSTYFHNPDTREYVSDRLKVTKANK